MGKVSEKIDYGDVDAIAQLLHRITGRTGVRVEGKAAILIDYEDRLNKGRTHEGR